MNEMVFVRETGKNEMKGINKKDRMDQRGREKREKH